MRRKLVVLTTLAMIAAVLAAGQGVALADGCTATVPAGGSIQTAINAASPGDKICVDAGTFVEDLSITVDNLELKGKGKGKTIVEGVAVVPGASFPLAAPNVDIQANGVELHGFTFRAPSGLSATEYSSGIVLTGVNIAIHHNRFEVGTGDISQGIQTWALTNAPVGLRDISGLSIDHNEFTNSALVGVSCYEGIYLNPQSDPADALNPVRIEHNKFDGALIRAVASERGDTMIAHNKMTTDCVSPFAAFPRGIQLVTGSHLVEHNKIDGKGTGSFVTGIIARSGSGSNTFSKNKVEGTTAAGFDVQSGSNLVSKNKAEKSSGFGFVDSTVGGGTGGTDNTYTKNKCKSNVLGDSSPAGLCK